MSKFTISQHLPPDVAEEQVDEIGKAVLTEQARSRRLKVTGEVQRIKDEFVVGVPLPDNAGQPALTWVPLGSPLAKGRTDADARSVTWTAEVVPITADPAVSVIGEVTDGVSSAHLPHAVTAAGGMVAFRHNLHGDVTVHTYDVAGERIIGYELAVQVSPDEQQVMLLPGAVRIEAVLDVEDSE